jgi:hypothetical protein
MLVEITHTKSGRDVRTLETMRQQIDGSLLRFAVDANVGDGVEPVLPQQIVGRLDHQSLDGRVPVKGELPQRLQSFWIDPCQDT